MVAARDNVRGEEGSPLARAEWTHRELYKLLQELEEARQTSAITELLDDLARLLRRHFAEEEGAGGLFAELEAARPANGSRLRSLRSEHRKIWQSLEERLKRVREPERTLRWIRRDVSTLVARIRGHEDREIALVMDTYLIDEGGSG
ncbi:MAG: hemerythrin domain-containing protein [Myxococcota bacterium]